MTTTQQDEPLLVRDARKRFGDVEALAGASIEVRRGELVGLLGPNGAGKTTMIRAIAGRVALDSNGRPIYSKRNQQKAIGWYNNLFGTGVAPDDSILKVTCP